MNATLDWIAEHRAQLAPLLVGFVGLYLVMPREHRVFRPLGILLGLAALGLLGFILVPVGMTMRGLLFYLFSATSILAAATTITHHNPVYSALSFALVTLSVCGLFLLRGAQFLAAATIIIYAGAIVVTFLFIIMLARQSGNSPYDRRARQPFLAALASFVLLGAILFVIEDWVAKRALNRPVPAPSGRMEVVQSSDSASRTLAGFVPIPKDLRPNPNSNVRPKEESRLRGLGRSLFTDYLVAVELAGTLLLVAGVGAVAIAPRRPSGKF